MAADPVWISSDSEDSLSEAYEHEECGGHPHGDYEVVVSPVVKVAMNLACIKQRLKKLPSLSEHQKRVMYDVTEEQIDSTREASNALARLYGCWDALDRRPETLDELDKIDRKLNQVR